MKSDLDPPAKTKRRPFIAIGIVLLLVGVGAALGVWYHDAHQNVWGRINFQEYAPSYLPDKLAIISMSIDARYIPAGDPAHTTVLNLKLSQRSFIYEQKTSKPLSYSCGRPITNTSCVTGKSTHGQHFLLTTTTIPGQPMQQVVEWSQGNTDIRVNFYGEASQPYAAGMAGKVIDSFHPVRYTGPRVNYYDNSKI